MARPDIHLYTASTMNGWKPTIFLEEAGVDYELTFIDFAKKEQKSDWYVALNPNGRIPTIVDHGNDDFTVFESGAESLQWLMFQMGGIGPMMGQAMYFQRIAAPNGQEEPFSIKRYVDESRRLLEVLDRRLQGRDFLVGEAFSIADIATYPWARAFPWAKVSIDGLEHLKAWFDRIDARPAVQRALEKPKAVPAFWGQADEAAFLAENAARFAGDVKAK